MTRSALLGMLVGALVLGVAAPAEAFLKRSEARRAAKHFVKKRSRKVDWKVTWRWVEPAAKCSRVKRAKVDCHYQFGNRNKTDSEGNSRGCFGDIRIRERAGKFYGSFLRERCGFVFY